MHINHKVRCRNGITLPNFFKRDLAHAPKRMNYNRKALVMLPLAMAVSAAFAADDDYTTLDTSVVSAAGYAQDTREAPASVSVITEKELATKPVTDLGSAIGDVPGVDISTNKMGAADISIRGFGSSYTLMTFLTSIFLGLSMGAGALFSIYQGRKDLSSLKLSILHAFLLILAVTLVLNLAVYAGIEPILTFLRVPDEVRPGMRTYLLIIFAGLIATSVYNFFSCMLRALGNSSVPLIFLAVSAVLNIALDLLFVAVLPFGIAGAALATVLAQYVSAVGILLYVLLRCRMWLPSKKEWRFSHSILKEILNLSSMTCIQQSVMNFGILMVQGLVNSFGPAVMAAFAAAVKIDTFAYLPVQDFGNAYSTFTAQNYGAGNHERIRRGTKDAFALSAAFSIVISLLVNLFAHPLMQIFVKASEMEVIAIGVQYLRLEGSFYLGIGWLFLLYGYYRAVKRAEMSVVLTVISLGMRVALAYLFSATALGVAGIWIAIPIGWALADMTGLFFLRRAFRSQKPA